MEDDLVNTRLICEILDRLGYEADAVSDGFEALRALTENQFSVVLMDMQLSELKRILRRVSGQFV